MSEDDDFIILGYQATYILTDGSNIIENFDAANLKEAAEYILQEISKDNRASVRSIQGRNNEYILLPVSSISRCYVRPRYQQVGDRAGGTRPVRKSELKPPD